MDVLNFLRRTDYMWVLWVALSVVVLLIFQGSLWRLFDHDEFEVIHASWKVLHGETLYVDFAQARNPLLYLVLVPVVALFGESTATIIAARVLIFVVFLLILVFTYLLSKKVFNRETALLSLVFLSTTPLFFRKVIEVRPDVPQTLFALISLFFLFDYFSDGKRRALVLSSVMLALSFLFLQKAAVLVLLVFILLLVGLLRGELPLRDFVTYLACSFLVVLPFFLYLVFTGGLSMYLAITEVLVKFLYSFTPYDTLADTFVTNTGLCVFFLLGLVFFKKTADHWRFAFLSFFLLLSVFLVRIPYQQYYMLAMPLVAAISAYAICSVFANKRALVAAALLLVVLPTYYIYNDLKQNPNTTQLERIEYVLEVADPDDYVYDGDIQFNLFRKDLDYFWYSVRPGTGILATYQSLYPYHYDIYELVERLRPKVVSAHYLDPYDPRIASRYYPNPKYRVLIRRD